MAKDFRALNKHHRDFIGRQHIFFTASAVPGSRVNVSPRESTCFRILSDTAVGYLDRTGSGNETAAHAHAGGHMTIMFCAVEGPPLILRLYGHGRVIAHGTAEYRAVLAEHFSGHDEPMGTRQFMRLDFDLVKTSCGYGVPFFDYAGERETMDKWCAAKGEEGLIAYREEKNTFSIDGAPTGYRYDVEAELAE